MDSIPVALFQSAYDKIPDNKLLSWTGLRGILTDHHPRNVKGGGCWSPVLYKEGGRRNLKDVVSVSCFVMDFDRGTDPALLVPHWQAWNWALHSSFSSTTDSPKWRAVFPLAGLVEAEAWPLIWRRLAFHLGHERNDPVCKDATRLFFLPQMPRAHPEWAFAAHNEGDSLEPALFPDPPAPKPIGHFAPPAAGDRASADALLTYGREVMRTEGRKLGAFKLAVQLRDNGYTISEARGMLHGSYLAGCPPTNMQGKLEAFGEKDIEDAVQSAYRYPTREPWGQSQRRPTWSAPAARPRGAVPAVSSALPGIHSAPAPPPATEEAMEEERLEEDAGYDGEGPPPPDDDAPPDDGEAGDGGDYDPASMTLANAFATAQRDRFLYLVGDQWWRYDPIGRWVYAGKEIAEASVQYFLTDHRDRRNRRPMITPAVIRNVLYLSKSLLGPHMLDIFAEHPHWIAFRNGVLDVTTRQFFAHDPAHYLTAVLPYDYNPEADCPLFREFLADAMAGPDGTPVEEWCQGILEWLGYCMIPDNRAQVSMIWVGEGGNGKGTMTRVLERLVGDGQFCAVSVENLNQEYHRARFVGKLVGLVNEPDRRALAKNGDYFKAITGGDSIDARNPTEKVFTFRPVMRLTISCNGLPETRDLSRGYFRRLCLIEWRNAPAVPDTHLDEKLAAELPGIANLALQHLDMFMARGYRFGPMPESDKIKRDYQFTQDPVAQFITDECAVGMGKECAAPRLYAAFKTYCERVGIGRPPLTAVGFGMRLSKILKAAGAMSDAEPATPMGANGRVRKGIELLAANDETEAPPLF